MITDKQTLKIMKSMPLHDSRVTEAKDILNNLLSELSKEQRIALVEEIGLSVVEWVDFLFLNCLTHPETHVYVMTNIGIGSITEFADGYAWFIKGIGFVELDEKRVTRWCELPQRKESK